MNEPWDVAIIGAGPAGATAAIVLARAGAKVLLCDKKDFPREKVCGDALTPDALRVLARLGLLDEVSRRGRVVDAASGFSASRIEVRIPARFVTIRRVDFDAFLVETAVAAGATFEKLTVTSIDDPHTTPRVGPFTARVVLVATGADVVLAGRLGLPMGRPDGLAIRGYVRSPVEIDRLILSLDRAILPGYGWIFPLTGGEYNVGVGVFRRRAADGVNLRVHFTRFLESFPLAKALMADGAFVADPKGARLRCGLKESAMTVGRVVRIGESIGTTFQFTGEGIGKAMESAEVATRIVLEYLTTGDDACLQRYPAAIAAELKPKYRGYEIAEHVLSTAWVGDLLARRAAASPSIGRVLEGIVNETIDPVQLFAKVSTIPLPPGVRPFVSRLARGD